MTAAEVAKKVAEDNNNPQMEGPLRLYLEAVERSGITFSLQSNQVRHHD